MQLFVFALSRLPDPYALLVGCTIGVVSLRWWQTFVFGVAGGLAMVLIFGLVGGMSSDAPAYFVVDAIVVAMWASLTFVLRERFHRYRSMAMQARSTSPLE